MADGGWPSHRGLPGQRLRIATRRSARHHRARLRRDQDGLCDSRVLPRRQRVSRPPLRPHEPCRRERRRDGGGDPVKHEPGPRRRPRLCDPQAADEPDRGDRGQRDGSRRFKAACPKEAAATKKNRGAPFIPPPGAPPPPQEKPTTALALVSRGHFILHGPLLPGPPREGFGGPSPADDRAPGRAEKETEKTPP